MNQYQHGLRIPQYLLQIADKVSISFVDIEPFWDRIPRVFGIIDYITGPFWGETPLLLLSLLGNMIATYNAL